MTAIKISISVIRKIGLAWPFLLFGASLQAQSTGADSVSFRQWVHQVEANGQYHFYYDSLAMAPFKLAVPPATEPVPQTLSRIFESSAFQFVIDNLGSVIISNGKKPLVRGLPPDFFSGQRAAESRPDTSEAYHPEIAPAGIANSEENRIIEIGDAANAGRAGNVVITGYIRDVKSGESIPGASLSVDSSRNTVAADANGYYSLTLSKGRHVIHISSSGMQATLRQVNAYADGRLNIDMKDQVPTLKTVVVVAERNSSLRRLQMGLEQLNIKTIKSIPVLMGEADVLRVLLTLPGVTSVGDASTGFNVRGGSADQNLILFNGATIYNPAHLFGFFSAFNSDVVKDVDLYKSSIPAKYGGRLSSVLDVSSRDGNSKKWTGSAGIGLLTGKLMLEGPIVKDKLSMIIGSRVTYSDWLLHNVHSSSYNNSTASFYDVDFHLTYRIDPKNSLYLTAYHSNDHFTLNQDTAYQYGNKNLAATWKHNFSPRLSSAFSGGVDDYRYSVSGSEKRVQGFELKFGVRQYHFRSDFTYSPNNNHSINFGLQTVRYELQPGKLTPYGGQTLLQPDEVEPEQARESSVYLGDKIALSTNLSVDAGIRYTLYQYLGPKTVFSYVEGIPREESTMNGTVDYAKGKSIKTYQAPELRLGMRYSLSEWSSVKASFNNLRQYIHLLYNTTAISPTDIWKLSDSYIEPQRGWQVSAGYYKNFRKGALETSVEVYYKKLKHFLDYKSGASLVMNHHIETDVIGTKGYAYGIELLIKKPSGKLNGWLSYTYSRTFLKQDDSLAGQLINQGAYYPANFDKPHSVNLISNYRFSHRYSISLNTIYSTGRPITLPIAVFYLAGGQRVYYSERNQYRIPDYFRMDFSVSIEGNHKVKQATHNSWSLGLYNLTGRKNPYSVYFIEEGGAIKGYKLSVIGTVVPYITFNLRF